MLFANLRIALVRPGDPRRLADAWRDLETRSSASFFTSWTWVGCLLAERFPDPWLLRAELGGRVIAMALLNRGVGRCNTGALWLHESGDPRLDSIYVEHNGPLLADGCAQLGPACLQSILQLSRGLQRLRLAGVGESVLACARSVGAVRLPRSSPAPFVDLTRIGPAERDYPGTLSANTRYQLRRSDRAYAAAGPLTIEPARSLPEALSFLDALAALHQARWTARGQPGAFADPWFRRFQGELLARAMPRGEAEILRVASAERVVGYLYNFRHRGRVLAYQSGFDYPGAGAHGKPGLTCHAAAITRARSQGMLAYDFLAGNDRTKASLANDCTTLHWLDLAPRWSVPGLLFRSRAGLSRAVTATRTSLPRRDW